MDLEKPSTKFAPFSALATFIDREPLKAWLGFCAIVVAGLAIMIASTSIERDNAHEDYWEMAQRHDRERQTRKERVPYETELEMIRRQSHEEGAVEIAQGCRFDEACIERQEAARYHVNRIRWAISSDEDEDRQRFLDEVYHDGFDLGFENGYGPGGSRYKAMDWIAMRRFMIRAANERGIVIFNECTVPYNDCYVGELR